GGTCVAMLWRNEGTVDRSVSALVCLRFESPFRNRSVSGADRDSGAAFDTEHSETFLNGDGLGGGHENGFGVVFQFGPRAAGNPDDVVALESEIGRASFRDILDVH